MKAYMFTDQGPAIRETPKLPPKANQVSVKVHASALNRVDLVRAQGAPHGSRGGRHVDRRLGAGERRSRDDRQRIRKRGRLAQIHA